ncbi:MAG: DUF4342 domain-containing protein [Candidatus Verstraetearchaeota archaeon]|nr:DUF4342 domain-containing protein [Candidatus Verstraetearchaeota archaeon]
MFCPKCGTANPEESNFCMKCGTRLRSGVTEEFNVAASELISKIGELIKEGNVTHIIIKNEQGKVLLELPATVFIVGAILAPWMAAIGAIAALATRCQVIVERSA